MTTKTTKPKENSAISKFYLLAYNLLQVVGWVLILIKLISFHLNFEEKNKTLWEVEKLLVIVFQNAAALEIVHAVVGLVKSNPVITTFQVLSRVIVVCAVIMATPANFAAASPGLPLALLAWSCVEIIRYSFYFSNLLGFVPYFLTWLRYSAFAVLYPIGITGELLCFYAATKYAAANPDAWSFRLPNEWNFTFGYYYFLVGIMISYIPLSPKLYLHMCTQRRKALSTPDKGTKKVR